jgi:hypothetical protein
MAFALTAMWRGDRLSEEAGWLACVVIYSGLRRSEYGCAGGEEHRTDGCQA